MSKPVTNIPEWADSSNAGNYTGGPYAGQPRKVSIPAGIAAEGFRPGADDPSAAEHVNDYLNQASRWLRWVYDGTAAGTATAHIVETTSAGIIQAQGAQFVQSGGPALTQTIYVEDTLTGGPAITAFGNTGSGPLINLSHGNDGSGIEFVGGVMATATCNGDGIIGFQLTTSGDTARAMFLSTTGEDADGITVSTEGESADGIEVFTSGDSADGLNISTSGNAADGVRAVATGVAVYALHGQVNNASAVAVQGLATVNGMGGRFYGGSTAGVGCTVESYGSSGIVATGGNSSITAAVKATGKANAPGVIGTGGPSGGTGVEGYSGGTGSIGVFGGGHTWGVLGSCSSNNGIGVQGTTTGAAGSSSRAVDGTASADGTGVAGSSDSGIGGKFTSVSGNAARFDAPGARPTIVVESRGSDPSSHEDGGIWARSDGIKVRRSGVTRRIFDTAGGMAFASAGPAVGTFGATPTVILSATFSGANIPVTTGTVVVRLSLEVGRASGTTANIFIEIFDVEGGQAVDVQETATLYQPGGVGVYERTLTYEISYNLPSSGAHTFQVSVNSTTAALINYRHANLTVLGVF